MPVAERCQTFLRFSGLQTMDGAVTGGGLMAVDQDDGQVDPMVPESYEHLLEDYSHFAPPAADEVLQGTVLGFLQKDVIIDFGYKSEGIVPAEQFLSPSGEMTVKRGDVIDVMIDHGDHIEG